MSVLIFALLAGSGGVGAATRFAFDGYLRSRIPIVYPLGTTVINVSGSLFLGLLTGLAMNHGVPREIELALGGGFLGGYTTFSTASMETVRLLQQGHPVLALINGVGMLILSVAAAALGVWVGSVF